MESIFLCLLAICLSSLVRCVLRSLVYFLKIRSVVFVLLSCNSSLYNLDSSPLSDVSFAIYSRNLCFLLILLAVSFEGKFLVLMKYNLSVISFMGHAFDVLNSHCHINHLDFLLCYHQGVAAMHFTFLLSILNV